jgi:predicted DNA-binding helix-hairpin-helix protein
VPTKARSRPGAAACFTVMARSCTASQPRLETARRGVGAAWRGIVGRAPHGWCISHLAVLVSPGLLAWLCGRRLPRGC